MRAPGLKAADRERAGVSVAVPELGRFGGSRSCCDHAATSDSRQPVQRSAGSPTTSAPGDCGLAASSDPPRQPVQRSAGLVLSLFPGVGLLDRPFIEAGFCVCAGPDAITGGDVRDFVGIPGRFDGLIAGPSCQGFSSANPQRTNDSHPSVQNSREMLRQTCRIILECRPEWFLIENVPGVPDVRVDGYSVQRVPISDFECGGCQHRNRHVQFGSRVGDIIRPKRVNDCSRNRKKGRRPKAVTTKTDRNIDFPDLCRKQGLPGPLQLPGWTKSAKFRAIGNGVPISIGRSLAAAVLCRAPGNSATDCECGCGRSVSSRAQTATPSCRKRKQLSANPRPFVDVHGYHPQRTAGQRIAGPVGECD